MTTEFRVLGPVEVWQEGRLVPLPAGRTQVLLAALLLRSDQVVPVEDLVSRVWGEDEADSRRTRGALYMLVARLRQALGDANVVRTTTNGYRAEVPPGALDLDRFRDLAARDRYAEALALWRGAPLEGLPVTARLAVDVAALAEEREFVLERRIAADLAAGRAADLVVELRELIRQNPLREPLWGHLMVALHQSGREAEALAAYGELRSLVAEELGMDPSPNIQRVHRELLAAAPRDDRSAVPRQLPLPNRFFVGRVAERRRLLDLVDAAAGDGAPVIATINGTPGVGKTALAVQWAHEVADRFPDGQVYVNLRGFDEVAEPMHPAEAVRGFLDALGVAPDRIPADPDAQAGLWRGLLAERRVCVVLDNARDSEHVRPLLPGGGGSLVLITSRNDLTGLVAREGAWPLSLDLLDGDDAHALLTRQVGAARLAAEPEAVRRLLAQCGGLPLALAIVGARAAVQPDLPLRTLADELADERTRLSALETGDEVTSVRAVFSWSCRHMTDATARVFRLLGLHPGPHVTTASAASLAAVDPVTARHTLRELVRARLLVQRALDRFDLHDLIRLYAADEARAHLTPDERHAATHRLLDHFVRSADNADRRLYPQRDPVRLVPALPGAVVDEFPDHQAALAWFTAEHLVLVAAVAKAGEAGFDRHAWQLAWTCATYFQRRGHWRDQLATNRIALAAGLRLGSRDAQVRAHRNIGHAGLVMRMLDDAEHHYRRAHALSVELGDAFGQGRALRGAAAVHEFQGRYRESLEESERALELFRSAGDRPAVAGALNAVGWYHTLLGDHQAAFDHCAQALAVFRQLDDRFGMANTLDSQGHALHHSGRLEEAVAAFREAVVLWRETGVRPEEARTMLRLARAERDLGLLDTALATLRRSHAIFTEIGYAEAEPTAKTIEEWSEEGRRP
ncbi:BTAD domain-containing putative transcriptional regulator [Saccharothrix sp. NPDC042600]|uniref:AfsR/SARP family transcriptional regulator n=1 Tax=Saccharothrix TaxID=2071 RepID=UPI0033EC845F|nr:BTAD domain-containing putative transcriptional regulator [Saccharothrix mutabilis subsp. capreolus]